MRQHFQHTTTDSTATADTGASSSAATGEATAITLWTYPIGSFGDSATVDSLIAKFNESHPESRRAPPPTSSWKDPNVWFPTGAPRARCCP